MSESSRTPDTGDRRVGERRITTSQLWTEVERRIEERRSTGESGATGRLDGAADMGATTRVDTLFGGTTNWLEPTLALTRFSQRALTQDADSPMDSEHVTRYGFMIGDLGFVLREGTPSEVLSGITVYPVPNTPPWMVGLINLRGNLVPTYDMALLIEREAKVISRRIMLVLEQAEKAIALIVDALPRPFRETDTQRLTRVPNLPARVSAHVQQALLQDDVVWLYFDHLSMVTALRQEFDGVE
ncbi:MAG: chemotaxis protein CheW [Gammaproteobacteria bacterium]